MHTTLQRLVSCRDLPFTKFLPEGEQRGRWAPVNNSTNVGNLNAHAECSGADQYSDDKVSFVNSVRVCCWRGSEICAWYMLTISVLYTIDVNISAALLIDLAKISVLGH